MKTSYLTLSDLITVLKKRIVPILLVTLLLALLCFSVRILLPEKYSATATFYVRNLQSEEFLELNGLTSSQLAVVSTLAKEYAGVAINGDGFLDAMINAHLPTLSREALRQMLSAAPDGTSFTVTATATDRALADRVIAAVEAELPRYIQKTAWPQLPADFTVVVLLREAAPAAVSSMHPLVAAALGALLAFFLSYLFFILYFLFSNRLHDAEEIARIFPEAKLLGAIPEITGEEDAAEFFYAVRERLPRAPRDGAVTLAVTSAIAGEGKSYVLAGIARSLAVAGKRVLVIDADLRRARKGALFLPEAPLGLSDYLKDPTRSPRELIYKTEHKGLSVLPAGLVPLSPCDVPFSERIADLLGKLAPLNDYILLDLPALGEASDAIACAGDLSATLLVVAPRRCGARELRAALATLAGAGGNMIGVVANVLPRASSGHNKL